VSSKCGQQESLLCVPNTPAGARGYAAVAPGDLSDALSDALKAGEPAVIHAKVDFERDGKPPPGFVRAPPPELGHV
jgi:hypothetical protein